VPTLSQSADSNVARALGSAWAGSTLSKYALGVTAFLTFCDGENIPAGSRLPASEHLLCAFAASRVGEISGSTAQNQISAVRAWHIFNNVPWLGSVRLNYVLHGVDELTPASSKRPPRAPITLDMLLLLHDNLTLSDPFDSCVFAGATSAHWAQLRLGEILSPRESSFEPGHIPRVSDLSSPISDMGSRSLHLPFTKTAKSAGDFAYICRQ
ncbi:hypothetical protein BV22DRAFT_966964, partial [Leucogyrophana mollusca]